jgi:hypothetical protein
LSSRCTIECRGIDQTKPAEDGERGDLWLISNPTIRSGQMRIELQRHAYPRLVFVLCSTMRGPNFGSFCTNRLRRDMWSDWRWRGL